MNRSFYYGMNELDEPPLISMIYKMVSQYGWSEGNFAG